MSKGVLLIALGHQNYKAMAEVLAASIRVNEPGLPIAIVTDSAPRYSHLFDHIITVEPNTLYHYYKLRAYDLSPFKQTIYLDVDMILLPKGRLTPIFDDLKGVPFTVMNIQKEMCIWAECEEVRKVSGNTTDPMFVYYSELMYFEKGPEAKGLFKEAQKQLKAKINHRPFAGGMADELALILAAMKMGIMPHKENWKPVFWHFRDKKDAHRQPYDLQKDYIAYSIGGNQIPTYAGTTYHNLARYYFDTLKLQKPYKPTDKRYFLTDRTKI